MCLPGKWKDPTLTGSSLSCEERNYLTPVPFGHPVPPKEVGTENTSYAPASYYRMNKVSFYPVHHIWLSRKKFKTYKKAENSWKRQSKHQNEAQIWQGC